MNRHLILTVAALFMITTSGIAAEPGPLNGTWKVVATRQSEESDWHDTAKDLTVLKHITGSHFTFVAIDNATDEVKLAFGGRSAVEGDKYVETVDYGPKTLLETIGGKKQVFNWSVDGNIFTLVGTLTNFRSAPATLRFMLRRSLRWN